MNIYEKYIHMNIYEKYIHTNIYEKYIHTNIYEYLYLWMSLGNWVILIPEMLSLYNFLL